MHIFTSLLTTVTLAAAMPLLVSAANANFSMPSEKCFNIGEAMKRMAPEKHLNTSSRNTRIDRIDRLMFGSDASMKAAYTGTAIEPTLQLGPVRSFGDLDGPNGELWYYTSTLYTYPVEYAYWTDYILTEYIYDIYDSKMNLVGSIHDKMRYEDNEVRVPGPDSGIGILPVLTKNFFNSDNKYELVVCIAANTDTEGVNNYRSVVYSINGEKETVTLQRNGQDVTVEVDKPITILPGFINDVLDCSTPTEECYYMTTAGDNGYYVEIDFNKLIDGDEAEGQKYWDMLSKSGPKYTTFAKADANGNFPVVHEFSVSYQQMQGDQENSLPFISMEHNGTGYIICPQYEESFFNPYYSPLEDTTMRENNHLVINIYKLDGSNPSQLVQTTRIPVTKKDEDGVLATYCGVGDLRYSKDVVFDETGKASFYITTSNYLNTGDNNTGYCFYVYSPEGELLKTIFLDADSDMSLTSMPGKDPLHLFVSYDEGYKYNFVSLVNGISEPYVTIDYLLKMDPEQEEGEILRSNVDLIPMGDTYKYAFEMRVPTVDDEDNDVMRIAWFNADGTFSHVDFINMGQSVFYAQAYILGSVLNPRLADNDDESEYWILIKRGIDIENSSASQEEFIIAKPESEENPYGKNLLHLEPGDKGSLRGVGLYPGIDSSDNALGIVWGADDGYRVDFYSLPFELGGIEEISADSLSASSIAFNGISLTADGQRINVYTPKGQLLTSGFGTVAVSHLPSGLYVATAGNSAVKFIVK